MLSGFFLPTITRTRRRLCRSSPVKGIVPMISDTVQIRFELDFRGSKAVQIRFELGFRGSRAVQIGFELDFWGLMAVQIRFELGFRGSRAVQIGFELGFRGLEAVQIGFELDFWGSEAVQIGFELDFWGLKSAIGSAEYFRSPETSPQSPCHRTPPSSACLIKHSECKKEAPPFGGA